MANFTSDSVNLINFHFFQTWRRRRAISIGCFIECTSYETSSSVRNSSSSKWSRTWIKSTCSSWRLEVALAFLNLTNELPSLSPFQGLICRDEGRFDEALKCFQRTIEFDSKNANNYKEIGKTLFVLLLTSFTPIPFLANSKLFSAFLRFSRLYDFGPSISS